ncbi:DUF4265 domain-containing protein [Streptomyces microflavus]|nr:DUF4265 domain-containing protein [Streptomyces microflavus]
MVTSISDDHVKVHFRLQVDEDGWPPTSVESLWAVDLGNGTVRLDNTPWFVRGVASDDIIRVEFDDEGVHWAGETARASENCTTRLIVLKDGGSGAARQTVLETFHRLGTTVEGIEQFRMVALDVPPDAELPRICRQVHPLVSTYTTAANTARSSTGAVPPPCGRETNFGINGANSSHSSSGTSRQSNLGDANSAAFTAKDILRWHRV